MPGQPSLDEDDWKGIVFESGSVGVLDKVIIAFASDTPVVVDPNANVELKEITILP